MEHPSNPEESAFVTVTPEDLARREQHLALQRSVKKLVETLDEPDSMGRYRLTSSAAKSDVMCMHCGTPLEQKMLEQRILKVTHPAVHEGVDSKFCALDPLATPALQLKAIGNMVELYHLQISLQTDTVIPNVPKLPSGPLEHTEYTPTEHMLNALQPMLGPHLQAIASLFHIAEILRDGEQWTFNISEDCGYAGQIIVRIDTMGGCEGRHPSSHDRQESQTHSHSEHIPDESGKTSIELEDTDNMVETGGIDS